MRLRGLGQRSVLFGGLAISGLAGAILLADWGAPDPARADGGSNQAPVADAGLDRTVSPGETVVLDGSRSSDIDGDRLTFSWQILAAPPGSIASLADATEVKPSFTADLAGTYEVALTVDDGTAFSAAETVRIDTANSAPIADAGRDRAIVLGDTVILDGGGSSDFDGDSLSYTWTLASVPAGSAAAIDFPTELRPSFFVDVAGEYVATLTVGDGTLTSAADEVVFSSGNLPPLPEAGPAATATPGVPIQFDPDGTSDADEDQLTARWTLLARPTGSTAGLSAPNGNRPNLTPDVAGTYVVQLRTDDGSVRTVDTIAVSTVNSPPVADAGPDQPIVAGQTVLLDGAASSDVDGDALSYRWSLLLVPGGSTATLDDPQSARPEFTADVAGTYVAQLIVDDGAESSAADTVVLSAGNTAPVADAGIDQTASQFSPVILDGSGSSDADLDTITYRWAVAHVEGGEFDDDDDGGGVTLSDPTAVTPILTFGGDDDDDGDDDLGMGFAVVQLLVSDGFTVSDADTVVISTDNSRPLADAGLDQEVALGALAQLDGGFSSDADSDPLTYRWSLIARPTDSIATLSDATAVAPSFTVDKAGLYVAQLIVNDGVLDSRPDTVVVLLSNQPPVADAGPDQDVFVGSVVALDGTGSSDPDLDPLTYAWQLVTVPTGSAAALSDATAANPTFVPDRNGDYVAELVVNDGVADSAPDSVTLSTVNRAPVADAGPDQSVTLGALVTLDGTASADPDNDFLTFAWTLTARPAGSAAVLANATSSAPSFTADALGFYTLELVVSDGTLESPVDQMVVTAASAANTPPVLDPVGNQTVALGAALSLTLTASDADSNPLSFFATPSPLPDGASLDAASGVFTFRPIEAQIGDVALTFGVSDGLDSDTESIVITVTGAAPGGVTAIAGRLLDANSAAAGQDVPVVGATVTIGGQTALTDAQGLFTIAGIPNGEQVLEIDGATAAAAPDGSPYGGLKTTQKLIFGVTNDAEGDFFLPRIDLTTAQTYDPAAPGDLTVDNPTLGATLVIDAGSVTQGGADYSGTITLSDGVADLALLPPLIAPCTAVSIQPFDLAFDPAAAITLPNSDNLPVSALTDIWSVDPATGIGTIVGAGTVTSASTITGTIPTGGLVFAVPRPPAVVAAADENADNRRPTTLADGNLFMSISLPSYRSLEQDRSQTFVYNSTSAAPTPIVAAEITFPADSGLPPLVSGRLEVGGVTVAGPIFTSTSDPAPLAAGDTIRQALQFPGQDLTTGAYPYRYVTTSTYACSTVGAATDGRVLVNNETDSPFGSGWTLAGLERLFIQDDGTLVLSEGDGTLQRIDPVTSEDAFTKLIGEPVDGPLSASVDDLDGDGNLDVAVPDQVTGDIFVLFGDGTGEFPTVRTIDSGNGVVAGPPDLYQVITADFDNNGTLDLIATNQNSKNFKIFSNLGNREFALLTVQPIEEFGATWFPFALGVEDFNGDGNQDVVVTFPRSSGVGQRLKFYFGNGAGGFPNIFDTSTFGNSFGFAPADYNNDGAIDIATLSTTANKVDLLTNNANLGGFFRVDTDGIPAGPIDVSLGRWHMEPADFNGDGRLDLVIANNEPAVSIMLGDALGGFGPRVSISTGDGTGAQNSVATADFNQDDAPDIAASSRNTRKITVLLNDGTGGFLEPIIIDAAGPSLASIRAGDFNNDGLPDLVSGSFGDGVVFTLLADPTSATGFATPPGAFWTVERDPDTGTYTRTRKDGSVSLFDANGLLTAKIDRNNNRTDYAYDPEGRLTSITDPTGQVTTLTYGLDGRLQSIEDPAGRISAATYDADGNLTGYTDVDDTVREMAYDANGRLVSELSKRGFARSHSYGSAGQWIGTGFPDGASVTAQISRSLGLADLGIGLGTEGNPAPYAVPDGKTTLTDARGNPYTMRFNRFGSVVEFTDPINRITLLMRNQDDLVTQVEAPSDGELPDGTKPGTVTTQLSYDERGNVTSLREATGTTLERETRFTYEPAFNQITRVVDASNGQADPPCASPGPSPTPSPGVTCFEYDSNGNQVRVIDSLGGEQVISYGSRGLRDSATDPIGNRIEFRYDAATFNLERVIEAAGDDAETVTRFTRDEFGNVHSQIEGLGTAEERTTSFTYDPNNRVLTETDGEGKATSVAYDASGNIVQTVDPTGIAITFTYDELERLIEDFDPVVGSTSRTYDPNGNLRTVTNALGNSLTLTYDDVDRIIRTTDPLLADIDFAYDSQNNVTLVDDALTSTTNFAYDILSREIRRTNALDQNWVFSYDNRDNLIETIDPAGQAVLKTYDSLSRLERVVSVAAGGITEDTITFTYDPSGNVLTATDSDSALDFTYDGLNRLSTTSTRDSLSYPGAVQPSVVLTQVYDAVGNRRELRHGPNPLVVEGTSRYEYDGAGRILRVTTANNALIEFAYDASGRAESINFPNLTRAEWNYDNLGRLASLRHGPSTIDLARYEHSYDAVGNVIEIAEIDRALSFEYDDWQRITGGGTSLAPESYSYDSNGNRVSSHLSANHVHDTANRLISDELYTYTYDNNGNLETKTDRLTGQVTVFRHNALNQLVRIEFPDGRVAAYRYDPLGRRIEKDVDGTLARYIYDGWEIALEFDGTNALQARFTHGDRVDQPLAMERQGQEYFFHSDQRNSIRLVTDAAGVAVNAYDYDAFGNPVQFITAVASPYAFTGREWDDESGLYYYRARYYDPFTGRFIEEDPLHFAAGDVNLYRYAFNNPVNLVDPSGLAAAVEDAGVSCAASALGSSVGSIFGAIAETLLAHAAHAVVRPPAAASAAEVLTEAAAKAAVAGGVEAGLSLATCGRIPGRKRTPGVFYRYVSEAEVKAIRSTGLLRGGRSGGTYFTTQKISTAARALRLLALPDKPTHRIAFRITNTPRVHGPLPVRPKYGQPGGGIELFSADPIKVDLIDVQLLIPF